VPLLGPQTQHFNYTVRSITLQKHLASTYIFEHELFPTAAVQQRQHVDALGCRTIFSGLSSRSVFDILQIPSGCIAHTCTPWLGAWQEVELFCLVLYYQPQNGTHTNKDIIGRLIPTTQHRTDPYSMT
jgi:hypothetical protein